jgi:hypothetical protein
MIKGMRAAPAFHALATNPLRERELVERAASLIPLAVRLERAILESNVPQPGFGGTVEQDVCEPFGAWYAQHCADHGGDADERVCRNRLADAVLAHFATGQTPLRAWAIVRAVRAVEPSLRLRHAATVDSINWEWAPRFAVPSEIRACEEHPLHPRSAWGTQGGLTHISEYWPWVEHRVRACYVRSRYEALAAARDIFMDLVAVDQIFVDGCQLRDLNVRRDLAGQECIEALPARTAFSAGLFSTLPHLLRAFHELDAEFDLEAWIARPISDFMSEYVRAADPNTTAIVTGNVRRPDCERPFECVLRALWNAQPEDPGLWRLEDGTVLKLLAFAAMGKAAEIGRVLATT